MFNRLNIMSKGSKQRPTNKINFDDSWDRIFGKECSQDEKKKGKKKAPPLKKDEALMSS
tara:strand:- start:953 stop:1129 length:177 start_codon:yes stop_codon:yes gene_type:complete